MHFEVSNTHLYFSTSILFGASPSPSLLSAEQQGYLSLWVAVIYHRLPECKVRVFKRTGCIESIGRSSIWRVGGRALTCASHTAICPACSFLRFAQGWWQAKQMAIMHLLMFVCLFLIDVSCSQLNKLLNAAAQRFFFCLSDRQWKKSMHHCISERKLAKLCIGCWLSLWVRTFYVTKRTSDSEPGYHTWKTT